MHHLVWKQIQSHDLCSTWQICRAVLTVGSIQLLNPRQIRVLDMIPFDEIMDIVEVMDNGVYLPLTMQGFEPSQMLQITTVDNGFNCGRIYRFKPLSDSFKVEIIKSARANNVTKDRSRSRRASVEFWQSKVRALFESNPVQYMLAIFIMAVRNRHSPLACQISFQVRLRKNHFARTLRSMSWSPS